MTAPCEKRHTILLMTGHDPRSIGDVAGGDRIATLPKPFERVALLQAIAPLLNASA